jgi:hypothetical protein
MLVRRLFSFFAGYFELNDLHSLFSFKNGILLAYDKKTNRSLSYDEFKNRLESEYLVTSKSDLEIKQI